MLEWFDPRLVYLAPVVFIAGFIDSVAGGGGLLTVPAYLVAGLPPTLTLGTNKCVSTIGTIVSTSKYILNGRMLWPAVIVGLPFTLLGSTLGAHSVARLEPVIVRTIILVALPIAAVMTLIPKPKTHLEDPITWRSLRLWVIIPAICAVMGWYDGFFGPGTGSLLILALYGISRLNFLHSAAIARFFNLASNAGALALFIIHGKVLYHLAIPLGAAGIAGHYLGSHLAMKNGIGFVRIMLAISVSCLFGYLIWQQFFS